MIKVRVPASTSNLGSGFDTFGLALKLYLTVSLMPVAAGDSRIIYSGEGREEVALDEHNLIYRSAKKLFARAGKTLPPLEIKVDNQIPLARGLGSSGAAIVAGLFAANRLLELPLADNILSAIAIEQEGHPENVSASLLGGLTISCTGGSQSTVKRVEVDPQLRAVVVIPDAPLSTEKARRILPQQVLYEDAVFNIQRSALLSYVFITGDYELLKTAIQDKIHQPYRKKLIPAYNEFEQAGYDSDALGVCISGSGSTIIAFTLDDGAGIKNSWQEVADVNCIAARTIILESSAKGAELV